MINKLGKMKDLYALKKQADMMKKEMEGIKISVEGDGYTIVMKGDQTVDKITLNGEELVGLKKLFNKAVKESQKKVAKKMRGQLSDMGLF